MPIPLWGPVLNLSAVAGDDVRGRIAALANGNFAVVYQTGVDDLNVRAFEADGTLVNDLFVVTSIVTTAEESSHRITALANGNFAVAWKDTSVNGGDVRVQLHNAESRAIGPTFTANVPTAGAQGDPWLSGATNGDLFISYTSGNPNPDDVLIAKADGAGGLYFGGAAASFTGNGLDDWNGALVVLPNDQQVVVYGADDGVDQSLRVTILSASSASFIGSQEFVLASGGDAPEVGNPDFVAAGKLASDQIAVAWLNQTSDLRLRIMNPDGSMATTTLAVAGNVQHVFDIAPLKDGSFIVSYEDFVEGGRLVRYAANGTVLDAPFALPYLTAAHFPSVATLADGRFVATYFAFLGGNYEQVAQVYDPRTAGLFQSASSLGDNWAGTGLADTVFLGAGPDAMTAGAGDDFIYGETGTDTLSGESGNDRLFGGDDDDTLSGGLGNDLVYAGSGADIITGGDDNDVWLAGEDGNDTVSGDAGNDRIDGGKGNDVLNGNADADYITGGDGNDTISGGDGNDSWLGGDAGTDTIIGGTGNDTLSGGAGNDMLQGEDGADYIYGGLNNDTIFGGLGNDAWLGGDGNEDFISGEDGNDRIDGGSENDILSGDAGVDFMTGGTGDDLVNGGDGNDSWIGGDAGNDTIYGDLGNDRMDGGAGNDRLIGEHGNDFITGGSGNDLFVYVEDSTSGTDIIADWVAGQDRIEIDASNFGGGLAAGPLAANRLVVSAAPAVNQAFGQFLFETDTGLLSWDVDGTGPAAALVLARLYAPGAAAFINTLGTGDFVIVA